MKIRFDSIGLCFLLWMMMGCATSRVYQKDRRKDVLLETSMGDMRIRLSDATPLHRDNFLRLVKKGYYDGLLFHRVIHHFMIQSGDPDSRHAAAGLPLGDGGPAYTVPAEFRAALFHKKGVIAAAREGDDQNPQKASSASQFYIVQGRKWTSEGLDSLEQGRLKGRKIPAEQRAVYIRLGGSPHLDQQYTIFGELVSGLEVLDRIAAVPTSKGKDRDRPLKDVRVKKARLVKRI
ncbi:peptidylprolyl isomerase [Niabella terrae]